MIYCGKKSQLEKFNRVYLPKDLIIEFNDDGSERFVRAKTGRRNYSDEYNKLPYLLGCNCKTDRYEYNTYEAKDTWIIKHGLKGRPMIQLYKYGTQIVNTEIKGDGTSDDKPIQSYDELLGILPENKPLNSKYDERINGEIHYIDEDTVEVKFSEPVAGYAICILLQEKGMIYKGNGSVWDIEHNLQGKPFTQVFDSQGRMLNAEVVHIDDNHTRISFFSGREYDLVENEDPAIIRNGYHAEMKEKIPKIVNGYAVLILDPTSQYIHHQIDASKEWEIHHNLNNYCIIQLTGVQDEKGRSYFDEDLYVMMAEIKQVNRSVVRVSFSQPMTGYATCCTISSGSSGQHTGCVIVVPQYELPDVHEAKTNTIYVIKETGFAYVTDDNFQWITITPGPSRIDGNRYPDDNPDMETDGNKWDKHEWEE